MPPAFLSTSAVDVGSAAAVRLVTRGLGDHVDLLALALVIAPIVSTFIIGARIAVRVRSKQMKQDDFWVIASGVRLLAFSAQKLVSVLTLTDFTATLLGIFCCIL